VRIYATYTDHDRGVSLCSLYGVDKNTWRILHLELLSLKHGKENGKLTKNKSKILSMLN
jgi:hypothetical protein